jgi:hypothetical protein
VAAEAVVALPVTVCQLEAVAAVLASSAKEQAAQVAEADIIPGVRVVVRPAVVASAVQAALTANAASSGHLQ